MMQKSQPGIFNEVSVETDFNDGTIEFPNPVPDFSELQLLKFLPIGEVQALRKLANTQAETINKIVFEVF